MTMVRVFCLLGLTILMAQTAVSQTSAPVRRSSLLILRDRLVAIAGPSAVNCRQDFDEGTDAATECALRSLEQGMPFYVEFDMQGFDTIGAGAIARNPSGKMFLLMFDSEGWSNDDLKSSRKGARLIDNAKIIIEPCPVNAKLYKTKSGRLTCFASGPDSTDPW